MHEKARPSILVCAGWRVVGMYVREKEAMSKRDKRNISLMHIRNFLCARV